MNETVACALQNPSDRYGCSARLEWHHVVKQQRLRRQFPFGAWRLDGAYGQWKPIGRTQQVHNGYDLRTLGDILGDPRNRVWLCSHHHELVTNGRIDVALPESVWEFAREFGLDAQLENDLARRAA